MEWVSLLQMAINYMETHLLEDINYEDVAKQVNLSSYNFHRIFSLMAGMTANEYIKSRRLSLAGQELQLTNAKVIDIAYKYGYDTPESFSKAFSRFHGVTPKQAKRKGTQLTLFNALLIKITLEGGKVMDYRIEETGKKRFLAKVKAFRNENINDGSNHEIPDFWEDSKAKKLIKMLQNMRPEGKRDLYGLCSPSIENEATFDYGIGILLDQDTVVPDEAVINKAGFQIWETKPLTYVVFQCFGDDGSCIAKMWGKFFKEFLPQSGYEHLEDTDYEVYYEVAKKELFCELWIPVKEKSI